MDTILDTEFKDVPAGKHAMAVMGQEGDTKYIWDPTKPDEVEIAKTTYESFIKKGYQAFKVKNSEGAQGERSTGFDPKEGRYIFVPQMQGG